MLYYNQSKAFRTIVLLALCLSSITAINAQESDPSPWSRFGLGINLPNYSSPQQFMGGVISPLMEKNVINPDQPASAASCKTTLFQSSIYNSSNFMSEGDSSTTSITGNLGALSMVIKKPTGKTALMFGIIPNSSKGYNLYREIEDENTGNYIERYQGAGGTARGYLGMARAFKGKKWIKVGEKDSIQIHNNRINIGAQVNYLFGELTQQEILDFEDVSFYDYKESTTMRHRAFGGLFGLQAHQLLGNKYDEDKNFLRSTTLFVGGTYATAANLNTDFEELTESIISNNGLESHIDTSFYESNVLVGQTPAKWTAGAALAFESGNGRKVVLAFDMMQQDWSKYNDQDLNSYLVEGNASWAKASRMSAGLSFKPASTMSGKSVLTRSIYRAGFAMDKYPLSFNDGHLSGWRATGGFSMPLEGSRSNSSVHFGFEFGKRGLVGTDGTLLDNTLEESILNFQLGVSLSPFFKNLWLTPKLYD